MRCRNLFLIPFMCLALQAQDHDLPGLTLSVSGMRQAEGLEALLVTTTDEPWLSGSTAFRIMEVKHQTTPQFSLRTGAGFSQEGWLAHLGVILARDPAKGAQLGLGLWAVVLPVGPLSLGLSLEALKSKAATQRQAVFTLGYHF